MFPEKGLTSLTFHPVIENDTSKKLSINIPSLCKKWMSIQA